MSCLHLEAVPVESIVTGEILARLCLTCDAQLPPQRAPEEDIWMTTERIR